MGKDRCVLCGVETEFENNTPIDQRDGTYVEGTGQLCRPCDTRINEETPKSFVFPTVAPCPNCGHSNTGQGEISFITCAQCGNKFYR